MLLGHLFQYPCLSGTKTFEKAHSSVLNKLEAPTWFGKIFVLFCLVWLIGDVGACHQRALLITIRLVLLLRRLFC